MIFMIVLMNTAIVHRISYFCLKHMNGSSSLYIFVERFCLFVKLDSLCTTN